METVTQNIKMIEWPSRTFITKRAKLNIGALPSFFQQAYGEIYGAVQKNGMQVTEPPCAFYYSIDEGANTTDMAAAVPVKNGVTGLQDLEQVVLPACKVVTTTHIGPYNTMPSTYAAVQQYMNEKGLKHGLIVEEYLSDPMVEKDASKWRTNIHFVVS